MASSLLGARIKATTSFFSGLLRLPVLYCSLIFNKYCISGTVKAKVFPEPVQALTQTSLFDRNNGITAF